MSPAPRFEFLCNGHDAYRSARAFAEAWARHAGLDGPAVDCVVMGFDEVLSNIGKYAFEAGVVGTPVVCRAEIVRGTLRFTISHGGSGLTNADYARLRQPPSCGERIGGLGLHVIGESFDDVDFRREDGRFIVELCKRIPGGAQMGSC